MPSNRSAWVHSPLGQDKLLFYRLNATESLGNLFDFDLEVLSEDFDIKLEDLLGKDITVYLELPDNEERHFHGFVSQITLLDSVGRYAHYGMQIHPFFWFLTRTADCRIFQNKSLPDIIKEVMGDFGFTDISDKLTGTYEKWDYCVQYRETAFNFISRLMEQEGIYYYFTHEEHKHKIVLSDSYNAHAPVPGYETIYFAPPEESDGSELDCFTHWRLSQKILTTQYALDDYDFEAPKSDLKVTASWKKKHEGADYKIFDYPGEYPTTAVGDDYVRYRREELEADYETSDATGTARGLMAGCLFELADHPRAALNKEYLVVSANHMIESGGYESGAESIVLTYNGSVRVIDSQTQYRTPRRTARPIVQGPQTAIVVGPSGEDVWTDKYGRVKVQFHWDRVGGNDENSSCWVRVSQNWAGKKWGGMFIPHTGQEVIISFLEGDPDRPIITGRVYNADNMPPKTLPANDHMSIIRDHFGNEIVFDGTPGDEHIELYSPHHESRLVLGRSTESYTFSDDRKLVVGTSWTHRRGDSVTVAYSNSAKLIHGNSAKFMGGWSVTGQAGVAISGFAGLKVSAAIGVDASISYGTKYTFGKAVSINRNKADYARIADEDIKLDSLKQVWLAGGNSAGLVKVDDKDITLSFGTGKARSTPSADSKAALIGGAVAALVTGASSLISQNHATSEAEKAIKYKSADPRGGWAVSEGDLGWSGIVGTLSADVLAVGAALKGAIKSTSSTDVTDPEQESEDAKITIDDKGVHIVQSEAKAFKDQKGVKLESGKGAAHKAVVYLADDGEIKILSKADIRIKCTGKIHLEQDVEATGDGHFKGKIWNPSLEAGT
jgi:type VI secretion system secreted protein VgrG